MLLLSWLLSLMPIQFCYGELWQQALFKCKSVIAPNVFQVTNCIRKWLEGEVRLHNICACMHSFRAYLHEGGGPQVGEVTCVKLPLLTCKRDHIKMRNYLDRRVTLPKRVTSPTWDPPPSCKQALISKTSGKCRVIYNGATAKHWSE